MKTDGITSEIHSLVDGRLAAGVAVNTAFVVTEIMSRHADIAGDDADFYRGLAAPELSRRVTKATTGRYDPEDITDAQLVLPGFKRLSKAYAMVRGGDTHIVPIDQCTDAEIERKATSLRGMGTGCHEHADELLAYLKARGQGAAA